MSGAQDSVPVTDQLVENLAERRWAANLATRLASHVSVGHGATVTWYNHVSVHRAIGAQIDVAGFDYVGMDGSFLRRIVAPGQPRTSADLVLPLLLDRLPGCRVALIGSSVPNLEAASAVISALPSEPVVVFTCDGYDGLLPPADMARRLDEADVDVVVVGLGAPLQDSYVLDLVGHGMTRQVMVTCGGWIDQVSQPDYYPSFAYRLKLNWLFRLLREPARLWRRYTLEGLRALFRKAELRDFLLGRAELPFDAMVTACAVPQESDGWSQSSSVAV